MNLTTFPITIKSHAGGLHGTERYQTGQGKKHFPRLQNRRLRVRFLSPLPKIPINSHFVTGKKAVGNHGFSINESKLDRLDL
jgi:hypothetical protein